MTKDEHMAKNEHMAKDEHMDGKLRNMLGR